ncbi:MAG: hypothetical protein ACJ72O_04045 [Marmoricola sp.]
MRARGAIGAACVAVSLLATSGCLRDHAAAPAHPSTSARPLTAAGDLRTVLLDPKDLGKGFVRDGGTDWFDDIPDLGCLVFIYNLTGMPQPQLSERRRIVADTEEQLPAIVQRITEYRSADEAETALKAYSMRMSQCHRVQKSSTEYGEHYDLHVITDHLPADDSVEEELNISAIGTIRYDDDPDHYDTGTWFTLFRTGRYIVSTAYDDADPEEYGYTVKLDRTLAQRLDAFIDGDPVPSFAPLGLTPTEFDDASPSA